MYKALGLHVLRDIFASIRCSCGDFDLRRDVCSINNVHVTRLSHIMIHGRLLFFQRGISLFVRIVRRPRRVLVNELR